jgi:hypothetical protein
VSYAESVAMPWLVAMSSSAKTDEPVITKASAAEQICDIAAADFIPLPIVFTETKITIS